MVPEPIMRLMNSSHQPPGIYFRKVAELAPSYQVTVQAILAEGARNVMYHGVLPAERDLLDEVATRTVVEIPDMASRLDTAVQTGVLKDVTSRWLRQAVATALVGRYRHELAL